MNESKLKSSVILRMGIIAVLTLLLFIPTFFVLSLVSERSQRRDAAYTEMSESWGGAQIIVGPILTIPMREYSQSADGTMTSTIRRLHLLPRSLKITGSLNPEIRYRGIYDIALYSGRFLIEGHFDITDLDKLRPDIDNLIWDDAYLTLGITDPKGLRDTVNLRWGDSEYISEPGTLSRDIARSGITFKPIVDKQRTHFSFSTSLTLNGTSEIGFIPVGEVTDVFLEAPWQHPSFIGSFLPHARSVETEGFHAEWRVLNLNRNFPQAWTGSQYNVLESAFGVNLYMSVDEYQKTSRAVKYALLFIALTFVSFFLSEIITKTTFHPIQYTLIGFALILFYVLLLSLSEHMRFNIAYVIASAGIVFMITLYSFWISRKKQIATVIFLVLVMLYTFLFVTLQLQDYALLLGSIGLFVVLFVIMYLTRKVDWFSLNYEK